MINKIWKMFRYSVPETLVGLFLSTQLISAGEAIDYHSTISPILNTYCISCHNDKDMKADISYEGLTRKDFLSNGQFL